MTWDKVFLVICFIALICFLSYNAYKQRKLNDFDCLLRHSSGGLHKENDVLVTKRDTSSVITSYDEGYISD